MCAMSPDWPTLSAFQLPCFCNSKVVASSNLGLELANAFGVGLAENRRCLGREPALAWPRTGVGLAENRRWLGPETVVGRLNQHAIVATVLCLLLRGRRTAARYSRLGPTFLRFPQTNDRA